MISRVKGTQDFLDLTLFNYIVEQAKEHFALYHFHEIATPIIEPLDLFKRSLGAHTDVVGKEMFVIESRHEQEDQRICLRPEMTAAVMRAFIENGVQQTPWSVFSYGPMFRHERPQKGRYRQFHQINLEIIGSHAIAQDAQCIAMLDRFFSERLGLSTYALLINFLGCSEDRVRHKQKLAAFLESKQSAICDTCKVRSQNNILRIFDCKNESCQAIYREAPTITQELCTACAQEWQDLQHYLQMLSISYSCVPTLVRGLDYYNKTVFEFVSSNLGAQSTFCGGGRYNQLASLLGAKQDYPSIGAAMGIERLMLLLEQKADGVALKSQCPLYVVMPMSAAQIPLALLIADMLHAHKLCAQALVEGDSLKSMMRTANKMGASRALIIGEDEQKQQTVMVKNMTTGAQEQVPQIKLVELLKRG